MHTVLEHAQTIFGRAYKTLVLSLPKGRGTRWWGCRGGGLIFSLSNVFNVYISPLYTLF